MHTYSINIAVCKCKILTTTVIGHFSCWPPRIFQGSEINFKGSSGLKKKRLGKAALKMVSNDTGWIREVLDLQSVFITVCSPALEIHTICPVTTIRNRESKILQLSPEQVRANIRVTTVKDGKSIHFLLHFQDRKWRGKFPTGYR